MLDTDWLSGCDHVLIAVSHALLKLVQMKPANKKK